MIAGSPPFQAASEYLIFQKIQKLEYNFPEGFDPQGRDLVSKMLVLDPEQRIGFADMSDFISYRSIKSHLFYSEVDFENLYRTPPPNLDLYADLSLDQDPIWDKYPDITPGLGADSKHRLLRECMDENDFTSEDEDEEGSDGGDLDGSCYSITSQSSCIPESGNISDLSTEEKEKHLEEQRRSNEYHKFVEDNLILKQGILSKKKGLWSRTRMFLLTEGPRLFYVDPKEKVLKGEIPLSAETRTEMKNFRIFYVHTPNRIYYLIDHQSYATQWCRAIEGVIDHYFNR